MEMKHVTPNGATVFFNVNDQLHSFCLCLYVKAGSMYEKKKENGISHFFEHIIFRNIHIHRNRNLYQTLDRLGLTFNAITFKELIQFSITGAPEHFGQAAEILTQIFEPISLPEEEINLERKRILAEMREEKDDDCVVSLGRKETWRGTKLERSIIGKKKILESIKGNQLRKFQKENLLRGSFFFYVTGNVPADAYDTLTHFIEKYPIRPKFPKKWENKAPVPKCFFHRTPKTFLMKGEETEVFFGFDLDVSRYTLAELDLLYDILFRGDYCRMYQELSEKKGYVYSYDPGSEQYANIAQIRFTYQVQMKNLLPSIESVVSVFQDLKEGIGDALDYVKANFVDNAYAILDVADDYNWLKAYEDKILHNHYESMEERITAYANVTPERMTQICREIFRRENMVLAIQGNKKKIPVKEINSCIEKL